MKKLVAIVLTMMMLLGTAAGALAAANQRKLDTFYNLAIAYINRENYDKAMEYIESALAICDEEADRAICADLHLKKGCIYTIKQEYDNAKAELDETLRIMPEYSETYLVKMQVSSETGDTQQAAKDLEKYIELSGETEIYQTLAQLYAENGDSENALRAYEAYLGAAQLEGAGATFAMANYKMDSGMYNEAIADYATILKDPEYGTAASFNTGICLLRQQNFEKALPLFEGCVDHAADLDGVYYNIGICHMMLEHLPEAVEAFGKSIETESYTVDALYNRAVCHLSAGENQLAAEDFTSYLNAMTAAAKASAAEGTEVPDVVNMGTYYRGIAYLSMEQYDKAEADFNACIDNDVNKTESTFSRGVARLLQGKYEDANADLTVGIEGGIDNGEAYYYRASARQGLGDNEGAAADLTACIDREYNLGESYYQRAQIYLAMGQEDKYVEDLETSLKFE